MNHDDHTMPTFCARAPHQGHREVAGQGLTSDEEVDDYEEHLRRSYSHTEHSHAGDHDAHDGPVAVSPARA